MKYLLSVQRLLLVCLSIIALQAHAIDYVYRAITDDSLRGGPDKIFKDGMHAPGANTNLYQHIRADSNQPDSGYISTTSNRDFAVQHGNAWVNVRQRGFWAYQIRPASYSIDVASAWRNMIPRLPASLSSGEVFDNYNRRLTREFELSFQYTIRNTDIVRAFFYPYFAGAPTETRENPNYVERPIVAPSTTYFIEIPELMRCPDPATGVPPLPPFPPKP